jgi:hypothetical protein
MGKSTISMDYVKLPGDTKQVHTSYFRGEYGSYEPRRCGIWLCLRGIGKSMVDHGTLGLHFETTPCP